MGIFRDREHTDLLWPLPMLVYPRHPESGNVMFENVASVEWRRRCSLDTTLSFVEQVHANRS